MSSISIVGLYNFDNSIFDDFSLPSTVDKTRLINNLLSELDELEVLYPDSDYMKAIIKHWSAAKVDDWTKLNTALSVDYDLAGNTETKTDREDRNLLDSANGNTNGTNSKKQAAFNSTSFENISSDTNSVTSNTTNQATGYVLRTYTTKYYGSIGLRTSAELLKAEIDFRTKYCIYDIIIMDFKERFCLLIY